MTFVTALTANCPTHYHSLMQIGILAKYSGQVEPTNSTMKRNVADASGPPVARWSKLLHVVTHNVMLWSLHFPRVETEPPN